MTHDILEQTRAVEAPSAPTLAHAREQVMQHATRRVAVVQHKRELRRRLMRRISTGIAVAAAATTVIALSQTRPEPSPVTTVAPANTPETGVDAAEGTTIEYTTVSQVLKDTATAAGASQGPGDAPYWKVVTQNAGNRHTRWIGVTGEGVMEMDFEGQLRYTSTPQFTVEVGGTTYTWAQINAGALNPADFVALYSEAELAHSDPSKATERAPAEVYFLKEATDLLASAPATPQIRQQMWKAIAKINGLTLDGETNDALGRTGQAFSLDVGGDWGTLTLVVDPSTGQLLEDRGANPHGNWTSTHVEQGPEWNAPEVDPQGMKFIDPS